MYLKDVILEYLPEANDAKTGLPLQEKAIYLPPFYYSELGTARRLTEIAGGKRLLQINTKGLPEWISRNTGMQYDEVQMQVILTAVTSKVLVLTGGPGTGLAGITSRETKVKRIRESESWRQSIGLLKQNLLIGLTILSQGT